MMTSKTNNAAIEAVIGIFENSELANRAATELKRQNVAIQRVSRRDPSAANEMPEIIYDEVDDVANADVMNGILKGGAIGAGSGLLFFGVPGLNIAAPIFGAMAGGWIGGIAAVDEAIRGIELPDQQKYQDLLSEGKSFIVISANEAERLQYANQLEKIGATEVNQHPPVREASFHERRLQG